MSQQVSGRGSGWWEGSERLVPFLAMLGHKAVVRLSINLNVFKFYPMRTERLCETGRWTGSLTCVDVKHATACVAG